jgi:hypothetical protein
VALTLPIGFAQETQDAENKAERAMPSRFDVDGVEQCAGLVSVDYGCLAFPNDIFGAGFSSMTWPVTSQSNSMRMAAGAA